MITGKLKTLHQIDSCPLDSFKIGMFCVTPVHSLEPKMRKFSVDSCKDNLVVVATTTNTNGSGCPKSCLKRRCSVPARPELTTMTSTGSCDSLSDVSSCESFKKSVSFADSVGEDLCHIKLFRYVVIKKPVLLKAKINQIFINFIDRKDLCEFEDWPDKMWRWHQSMDDFDTCNLNEEDEEFLDELYDDFDEDYFNGSLQELEVQRKTSGNIGRFYFEAVDEDDFVLTQNQELLHMDQVLACIEDNNNSNLTKTDKTSNIVPTFLEPKDLPDFHQKLQERGVCLESASVLESESVISGTIKVKAGTKPVEVLARFSLNSWASSEEVETILFKSGERYGFIIPTSDLQVGEDLELIIVARTKSGSVLIDDNKGLKYRFICKPKSKFRPGKSLW